MERIVIEFSAAEEIDPLECDLLPPLPEEEEKEEVVTLRPPRFFRSHDSLRVARHRTEQKHKKTRSVKPQSRSSAQPHAPAAASLPKKQETAPAVTQKPPPQTGESPTARRGRSATRRVARMRPENPSR